MKTVYPVIAAVLSALLLCGCLRYDPQLLTRSETDPSFEIQEESKECNAVILPFIHPESDEEETTELSSVEEIPTEYQTELQTEFQTAEETTTQIEAVTEREHTVFGTAGRLEIPSVGICVPLNFVRLGVDDVQKTVDAQDSAAYFWLRDTVPVIADHNNQGFADLYRVKEGEIAIAYFADGHSGKYVCTRVCRGTNTGTDLLDENGVSVSSPLNAVSTCLIMYTCYDGWHNVLITYWKAI